MEVKIMKNTGIKIETILSLIVNVILAALVFAYLDANASVTAATVAGIAVVVLAAIGTFTFPKLINKAD
jgi:FtsH-binding integral membrane protein